MTDLENRLLDTVQEFATKYPDILHSNLYRTIIAQSQARLREGSGATATGTKAATKQSVTAGVAKKNSNVAEAGVIQSGPALGLPMKKTVR